MSTSASGAPGAVSLPADLQAVIERAAAADKVIYAGLYMVCDEDGTLEPSYEVGHIACQSQPDVYGHNWHHLEGVTILDCTRIMSGDQTLCFICNGRMWR